MISRKKKIILIQITIFLVATLILYNTYRDKNVVEILKIEVQDDAEANNFTNIVYSGFDLNGNRYVLKAADGNFKTENPENINMKSVVANFYLDNGAILKVISDTGFYNNITLDMRFEENVKTTYLTNTIFSDELVYSNSSAKLIVSGNVNGKSVEKGEFFADSVEYNLTSKTLDFSMFDNKQVNVKLKN